jgi:hypothetical protein
MVGGKLLGNSLAPFEHVFTKAWEAPSPYEITVPYLQNDFRKIDCKRLATKFDLLFDAGSRTPVAAKRLDQSFRNPNIKKILNWPIFDLRKMRKTFGHSGLK